MGQQGHRGSGEQKKVTKKSQIIHDKNDGIRRSCGLGEQGHRGTKKKLKKVPKKYTTRMMESRGAAEGRGHGNRGKKKLEKSLKKYTTRETESRGTVEGRGHGNRREKKNKGKVSNIS